VVVQDGDTYYKIAQQLDMRLWQLHNYNETGRQTCLEVGNIVYLQPKRRHSQREEFHTVRWGETMYYISQLYGIKMRHLYRMNHMLDGQEPNAGQKIVLR
jgi:LysM repeat protein